MNRKDLPEPNATCQTCGHRYRICNKCLQMRSRGIEAWRQHCDCAECYLVYAFVNQDYKDINKEQYDRIMAIELPDGREYVRDIQMKLDGIEQYLKDQANQ